MKKILYISLYEPMPVNGVGVRKMRNGFLSDALLNRGNEVTLVIPGFDHSSHTQFYTEETVINLSSNYKVVHLPVPEYKSDVSLSRLYSDKKYAKNLGKFLDKLKSKPDIIVTQIPSLRMSYVVAKFAVLNGIKYIVDVRDPWPDIYKRLLVGPFIYMYKYLFFREIKRAKYIFNNANAIVGVSESYVNYGRSFLVDSDSKKYQHFYIGMKKSSIDFIEHQDNKLQVLYCGTFGRNLDIKSLIAICNKLDSSKFQVHVIGSGEGEDDIKEFSHHNPVLKFHGWKNSVEINKILMICDVGLSLYPRGAKNSLTNKYFEYMAYGLYNISSLNSIEAKKLLNDNNAGITFDTNIVENFIIEINNLQYQKFIDYEKFIERKFKIINTFNTNYSLEEIYDDFAGFIESI